MPKYHKAVDKNQSEIISYLEAHGCQVVRIGEPLDILIGYDRRWLMAEIKPSLSHSIQRGQLEFLSTAKAHVAVVVSPEEAWQVVQFPTAGLTPGCQLRITQWLIRNPEQGKLSVRRFRAIIS